MFLLMYEVLCQRMCLLEVEVHLCDCFYNLGHDLGEHLLHVHRNLMHCNLPDFLLLWQSLHLGCLGLGPGLRPHHWAGGGQVDKILLSRCTWCCHFSFWSCVRIESFGNNMTENTIIKITLVEKEIVAYFCSMAGFYVFYNVCFWRTGHPTLVTHMYPWW